VSEAARTYVRSHASGTTLSTEEVTMIPRRIIAGVCALALTVPAVASARSADDPVAYGGPSVAQSHVGYGDTKYDLQNTQDLAGTPTAVQVAVARAAERQYMGGAAIPVQTGGLTAEGKQGDTKNDVTPTYADRVGSLSPAQLAAAYGTTTPKATPVASPAVDSTDDNTDGWRLAAVAEAGLLAAFVLGAAAFVGRMRPRRGAAA
jgi:hypothetical protein